MDASAAGRITPAQRVGRAGRAKPPFRGSHERGRPSLQPAELLSERLRGRRRRASRTRPQFADNLRPLAAWVVAQLRLQVRRGVDFFAVRKTNAAGLNDDEARGCARRHERSTDLAVVHSWQHSFSGSGADLRPAQWFSRTTCPRKRSYSRWAVPSRGGHLPRSYNTGPRKVTTRGRGHRIGLRAAGSVPAGNGLYGAC